MKKALIGCGGLMVVLGLVVGAALLSPPGRAMREAVQEVLASDELQGKGLKTADDVAAYLAAHPDRFALAAWDVGDEANAVVHDADGAWPLASSVKLVPLALASEELAAGRWSVNDPTPEVEDFYLPGTDGNAHLEATADGGSTATVGGALHAMISFSDNAATDAILFRLGRARFANDAGLPLPHPLAGTMLLSTAGFDGGAVDDEAWRVAASLKGHPRTDVPRMSLAEQARMSRVLDNRGTPRAFGRLIEKIFTEQGTVYATARAELQWPMKFENNRRDFRVFGTKGGSLVGTITDVSYAETHAGQRRVFVLFLHDLPFATWLSLMQTFAQQAYGLRVLKNPDGLEQVRSALRDLGSQRLR